MEDILFSVDQNLRLFREMISCGTNIYSWVYTPQGELQWTDCQDLVFDKVLQVTGCKDYMLEYSKQQTDPMILSAPVGFMWCAAFEQRDGQPHAIHLIGPVFGTELSVSGIEAVMRQYDIPLNWRSAFFDLLQNLPVVSTMLFFQYALMLHYCVTGEKRTRSQIQFQHSQGAGAMGPKAAREDRLQVWMVEQALLRNVREGDINFHRTLERAGMLSKGIQISTQAPILQAIITESVFISLCARAAIEGGLSPEIAYSLGDSYIQSATLCENVTDLKTLGYTMYDDFIHRVRNCRTPTHLSSQTITCRDYIELHLEDDLTLEQLSRRVGYAPYYFSKKFKREMGVSVSEYIRMARVEKARALLSYSDESIAHIAERLRFSSSSHFSSVFRSITGQLPQEYRAITRKQ